MFENVLTLIYSYFNENKNLNFRITIDLKIVFETQMDINEFWFALNVLSLTTLN